MRTIFALLIGLAVLALESVPAHSENAPIDAQMNTVASTPYSVTADYAVYAGGFKTLAATATILEEQENYATYVTIKTDGMLKMLAPWSGILSSTGRFTKNDNDTDTKDRLPKLHAFDNIWRGTNKRIEQHYNDQGQLKNVTIKEDRKNDEIKQPDATLANGATDILSAALEATNIIQKTGSCNSSQPVYDGKRRFILNFKEVKRETFKKSRYSSYVGEAIKCVVEITPDGGKWRDKKRGWMSIQEQSKEKGHPPYIWFGKLSSKDNLAVAYAPVKLQVKTSYGTLMLHMKSAKITAIKAE